MKRGNWHDAAKAALIVGGAALLGCLMAYPLALCLRDSIDADRLPDPVRVETYTQGSFDEIRLSAYYSAETYPERPAVPELIQDGRKRYWELVTLNPPDGGYWEAIYRECRDR